MKKYTRIKNSSNNPLPSTSKESDKTQVSVASSLPHIVAVPTNSNSKMKILQLSPLKCPPKGKNINVIKLGAGCKLLDVNIFSPAQAQIIRQNQQILKPIQLKIPINKSIQSPILSLVPSQSMSNVTAPSKKTTSTKTDAPRSTPTKKHQPNILNRKTSTAKITGKEVPEKDSNVNAKNAADKSGSNLLVKDIIRKAKNQKAREKRKVYRHLKQTKSSTKSEKVCKEEEHIECAPEELMYIANGFRSDVETLLERCSHMYKLNYIKFCDVWKEMDFVSVFHGKRYGAELAEFTEEALHIAKYYMLAPNISFEENVAGLFLVYGIFNLQPFPEFAALRLVPSDVAGVLRIRREAAKARRHDVLFVLGSLLASGACHFVLRARPVGMEISLRKYHDGTVQIPEATDSVFTRNGACVAQLKELVQLDQRYQAIRQRLSDAHAGAERVRKLSTQPAASLLAGYNAHIPRPLHADKDRYRAQPEADPVATETDDRIQLMKSIKDRAMTNVVDNMRHLTGVEERWEDLSSSDSEEEFPSRFKGKKNSGGRRFTAVQLQELFHTPDAKQVEIELQPSTKEMPTIDGFGDLGADVNDKKNNKTKNNNKPFKKRQKTSPKINNNDANISRTKNEKLDLSKRKRKRKTVPKKVTKVILDSGTDSDLVEVEQLTEHRRKVKRKYTRRNTTKVNSEKNNSNYSNTSNESPTVTNETSDNEFGTENATNRESTEIQGMSREEEIHYLKSIIEEIEGSIERDPSELIRDKGPKSESKIPKVTITTVECEFDKTPKIIKKCETGMTDNKVMPNEKCNIKTKDETNKEDENNKKSVEMKIIPKEATTSKSSDLNNSKTKKTYKNSLLTALRSQKAAVNPKNNQDTVFAPKIIEIRSLSTNIDNMEDTSHRVEEQSDKEVAKDDKKIITNREYLEMKHLKSQEKLKRQNKKQRCTIKKLGIADVAAISDEEGDVDLKPKRKRKK